MQISLDPETRPTLTVDETAVVMGVARSTCYEGVRTGAIPSIRIGGRVLIPTAALRRLLAIDEPLDAA